MNTTATLYEAADRPLTALLESVPNGRWTNPSPCEGWSARDVLWHLIETQRDLLLRHEVDLGEAPDRDPDPATAWRRHAKRVAGVLSDDAVPAIAYDGYFGPTTLGATLEQFYIWDMLVHRWDIAQAVGAAPGLTGAELDRIESGADSFGDALYLDGVCRSGVEVPDSSGRERRLLARLGRGQ